jgi:hypothetical protein
LTFTHLALVGLASRGQHRIFSGISKAWEIWLPSCLRRVDFARRWADSHSRITSVHFSHLLKCIWTRRHYLPTYYYLTPISLKKRMRQIFKRMEKKIRTIII